MKIKLIFLGKKKRNSLDDLMMKYFSRIQKEISSELIFVCITSSELTQWMRAMIDYVREQ